jgi:hypothetical protein
MTVRTAMTRTSIRDGQSGIGRTRQVKPESQYRTDRPDRRNTTGKTGHEEQERQNRAGRTGQAEKDRQNRTGRTGQAEQDRHGRTSRTDIIG